MPEKLTKNENSGFEHDWISNTSTDSELIIGLVGAVGTDLQKVSEIIKERLSQYHYNSEEIRVSKQIIKELCNIEESPNPYEIINSYMTAGNQLRERTGDYSILALASASKINQLRCERQSACGDESKPLKRFAFIINSLKLPDEVKRLRNIYPDGFFLIGVHTDEERRNTYLRERKGISVGDAKKLIERDEDESVEYGQHTRDTFQHSDFFINFDGDEDRLCNDIWRIISLIFGKPFVTPTFDEFAMFMAFSASLRSADLSRQVGAVLSKNKNIVSTGANDVPCPGGGLYWPEYDHNGKKIVDAEDGRDYMCKHDSNAIEKNRIINEIIEQVPEDQKVKLEDYLRNKSSIKDITEYGRIVHAEMEAILACSRNKIGTKGTELYCTTFPCHNCAKHIIAAGIKRVVYIEPYPKSKAFQFHSDSISTKLNSNDKVVFEPFVGVGPRNFFNLFSMKFGSGYPLKRKNKDGTVAEWDKKNGRLRMQMLPCSYLEREDLAANLLSHYLEEIDENSK